LGKNEERQSARYKPPHHTDRHCPPAEITSCKAAQLEFALNVSADKIATASRNLALELLAQAEPTSPDLHLYQAARVICIT
jgi:hypothetical protein